MQVLIDSYGTRFLRSLQSTNRKPTGELYYGSKSINNTFSTDRSFNSIEDSLDTELIDQAYTMEGYFRRILDRFMELIWKRGYTFKSSNKRALKYIKKRFAEITKYSGKSLTLCLLQTTSDLLKYSNAFLFKFRSPAFPVSGNAWNMKTKTIYPIVSLINIRANDIIAELKQTTSKSYIKKYIITTEKYKLSIKPEDMIHFKIFNSSGEIFGNAMATPIIPDIRALRRIEENVELLVFDYSIPFFHAKVGTPETGTEKGEIPAVRAYIESMPLNGIFTTDYRVNLEAISSRQAVIDIHPFLEHFKKRIFGGLGSSAVELGESSTTNKSTSLTVNRITQDRAKFFQLIMEEIINKYLLEDILKEGRFDITNPRNLVYFKFLEIDLDELIALESHNINAFNNNTITFSELRQRQGEEPMTEQEMQQLRSVLFAGIDPWSIAAANTSENKVHPENQYGKKAAPTESKNK